MFVFICLHRKGYTALMYAAEYGHAAMVALLLVERGANIGECHEGALYVARKYGRTECKLILKLAKQQEVCAVSL